MSADIILTEAYRPASLTQVVGQDTAIMNLRAWADSWKIGHPSHKAALLYGPPGIGKTSAANAMAKDYGWNVLEINTNLDIGGRKSKDATEVLLSEIANAIFHRPFDSEGKIGGRTLIVIEEAESLKSKKVYEKMGELIPQSVNPIIITCNDEYALRRKLAIIREISFAINFRRLNKSTIRNLIYSISQETELKPTGYLDALIEDSHGDLRFVLNNFVHYEPDLSSKDKKRSIFEIIPEIVGGRWDGDCGDNDPEEVFTWLKYNIYNYYDGIHGVSVPDYMALISKQFDRVYKHVGTHGKSAYRYWAYAVTLMKLLPPHTKSARPETPPFNNVHGATSYQTLFNMAFQKFDLRHKNIGPQEQWLAHYLHIGTKRALHFEEGQYNKIFASAWEHYLELAKQKEEEDEDESEVDAIKAERRPNVVEPHVRGLESFEVISSEDTSGVVLEQSHQVSLPGASVLDAASELDQAIREAKVAGVRQEIKYKVTVNTTPKLVEDKKAVIKKGQKTLFDF